MPTSAFWHGNTFGNGKSIWQSGVSTTTKKLMSVVGNYLKLEYTNVTECQYTTENTIDFTNYSKLTAISSDNQTLEVDISNVSGNYNICLYSSANTNISGRNIIFMYVIATLQTPYQQAAASATTGWGANWSDVRAIVLT